MSNHQHMFYFSCWYKKNDRVRHNIDSSDECEYDLQITELSIPDYVICHCFKM